LAVVLVVWFLFSFLLALIGSTTVAVVGNLLIKGVITGYIYCLSAAIYQELWSAKTGMGRPTVASVFD